MESRTLSSYRWVVLLVSCLIIFIADYIQFQLSALATEIMPALGIDVAQFSALLLAPLLAGVFVSIPAARWPTSSARRSSWAWRPPSRSCWRSAAWSQATSPSC